MSFRLFVAILTSMPFLFATLAAAQKIPTNKIGTGSGAGTGGKQASLCTPAETVVFACHVGAKLVSVCASADAAPNKGYVQYRFGKPDTTEPVELALPEGQVVPARAATGGAMGFSGGGGAWMRFRKGAFAYAVYTGIGNWGPNGEKRTKEGLLVERDGKRAAVLKCSDEPQSELGPDWFEKAGINDNNEDFDFPD